jgi:uncharacterized protein (DUF433 family)
LLWKSCDPIVKSWAARRAFAGTRVPVKSLFDYLEGGYTIDYFLEQFPTVKREQVMVLLRETRAGDRM